MKKFLLHSILLATIVIPMLAASDRSPQRGFRRTLVWMAVFNACYVFGIIYVLPRLPF
jgi:hypothetical protein